MGMGGYGLDGGDEEEAMKDLYGGAAAGAGDGEGDHPPVELKVGEEREIGEEGLKKKLVKKGEGWDRPGAGDEVEGEICFPRLAFRVWDRVHMRADCGCGLVSQCTTRGR